MEFRETTLDNGLQIVAEQCSGVHSVALGFFVRTGARDENDAVSGVSHFLEHMAFKGTSRHSADDVNRVFDEVGAKYNASTSEETTLFYAAILPEYLTPTFDLLADIIRPALRQEDFDMEKKVILEEIGMYEDQPTYTAYERLMQTHFAGHPLGRSVLGTADSITALTSQQMRDYHARRYTADNVLLAVAGRFDHDEVVGLAQRFCGSWPAGRAARATPQALPPGGAAVITKPGSQQEHVMQMTAAPPAEARQRFAADLLSVIIGDDTGSRLFWELVDPGHAETAEMGYNEFDGSGAFLCYFSCPPTEVERNLARVRAIFDDINRQGVSDAELEQARNKVASRIVLRSERPMGRLSSLGHNWLYRHEYRSVADDLAALRAVTRDDLRELLDRYPLAQTTISAVGPLEKIA